MATATIPAMRGALPSHESESAAEGPFSDPSAGGGPVEVVVVGGFVLVVMGAAMVTACSSVAWGSPT